jgi:hypothetical protein
MRLSALVITLSISACVEPAEPDVLPSDAHYVAVFAPFTSPEDCLANSPDPRGCRFAITLCANGRAAKRTADIVDDGHYYMEGPIAHAVLASDRFDFDVETVIEIGSTQRWIVDDQRRWETLQFDTISCD